MIRVGDYELLDGERRVNDGFVAVFIPKVLNLEAESSLLPKK